MDTHVILWLAMEPAKISLNARKAIEETRLRGEALAISDISLLEIATLERKNRLKLNTSLETFLSEIENRFAVLPITARICVRAAEFPAAYPKDPADRIIAATALVEGASLITADEGIRRAKNVRTVW